MWYTTTKSLRKSGTVYLNNSVFDSIDTFNTTANDIVTSFCCQFTKNRRKHLVNGSKWIKSGALGKQTTKHYFDTKKKPIKRNLRELKLEIFSKFNYVDQKMSYCRTTSHCRTRSAGSCRPFWFFQNQPCWRRRHREWPNDGHPWHGSPMCWGPWRGRHRCTEWWTAGRTGHRGRRAGRQTRRFAGRSWHSLKPAQKFWKQRDLIGQS